MSITPSSDWLVVEPTPLKNMKVSCDYYFQYMGKSHSSSKAPTWSWYNHHIVIPDFKFTWSRNKWVVAYFVASLVFVISCFFAVRSWRVPNIASVVGISYQPSWGAYLMQDMQDLDLESLEHLHTVDACEIQTDVLSTRRLMAHIYIYILIYIYIYMHLFICISE